MGTLWPTSAIYSISCQYKLQISTSTLYFVTILMLYCIARCTTYLYYNAIWGLGIFCWSFLFLKHPFLKNLYFMGTLWPTLAIYSISTVTEWADFGFFLLLWRPQGSQGCLKKQNHPLSLNLAVWCAKMDLKTKKLSKTIQKLSFFVISEIFQT